MGFLMKDINGEENDPDEDLEELYLKLSPKIFRDAVCIEDLKAMMEQILFMIDPLGLGAADFDNSGATDLVNRYKKLLDKGKGESERDLVELKEKKEKKNKE